jgi:hypothetical protein
MGFRHLDLALQMIRTNSGVCGVIMTGPGAGEPKTIYPALWARNEDLATTLEDERS